MGSSQLHKSVGMMLPIDLDHSQIVCSVFNRFRECNACASTVSESFIRLLATKVSWSMPLKNNARKSDYVQDASDSSGCTEISYKVAVK